jgi:hypothetical protein
MSRRISRLTEHQLKVAVMAQRSQPAGWAWSAALVAGLAGLFYFFGLFFGHNLWRVLVSG